MPSPIDLVSFAELVQLGREHAKTEWKRVGGKLDACAGAELLGAGLSSTEQSCLRYGYREQLHTLNCRDELARRQSPPVLILSLKTTTPDAGALERGASYVRELEQRRRS